jgi:Haem-NO-binding
LDMASDKFGDELLDSVIDGLDLPSGCAYTSVGTYDYQEIVALTASISAKTQMPVPDLLRGFGKHLFGRFADLYPALFEGIEGSFNFLEAIEKYIHVEVRKLYPDAELPSFDYSRPSEDCLVMTYHSCRPLGDLCRGLMEGCLAHFDDDVTLEQIDKSTNGQSCIVFQLSKAG